MRRQPHGERDLRTYARNTQIRLILGALIIIFAVGSLLIWWIYGSGAASLALLCMGVGLAPAVLILIMLELFAWIVRRSKRD